MKKYLLSLFAIVSLTYCGSSEEKCTHDKATEQCAVLTEETTVTEEVFYTSELENVNDLLDTLSQIEVVHPE